jgi:hypothetical protein
MSFAIEILDVGRSQHIHRVAFRPIVRNANLNDPLVMESNDLVSWSNRTDENVTLEFTSATGNRRLMILAGDQTDFFSFTQSITYHCTRCRQQHMILVN